MLVPLLFKENNEWLFMFGDVRIILQQTVQPSPSIALHGVARRHLLYKGTAIRMDRISITKCESHIMFLDAVALLMAAYFVHGIEYPQKLKN